MSKGELRTKPKQTPSADEQKVRSLEEQIKDLQAQIAQQNQAAGESVPLSQKKIVATPAAEQFEITKEYLQQFNNKLDLPIALKKEISEKGYVAKFININEYNHKGKMHSGHWIPYIPEEKTIQDTKLGRDPEGYLRRGDLVLAVRSFSVDKAAKQQIEERNKILKGHQKRKVQEMQAEFADKQKGLEIVSGYEDPRWK